jgi:hypothetical protein
MKRKDMVKKIEAGESLVDICLEKYREVQYKITNDEEIEMYDIGVQTCALCYKYNMRDEKLCEDCPLYKAGYPCNDSESNWNKLYHLVKNKQYNEISTVTKEELQNATDGMISDLKNAKLYEENTKTPEETEQDIYIEGEKECGLKVGDTVKVIQTAESYEGGWSDSWIKNKMFANTTGKITNIQSEKGEAGGIEVKVNGETWQYPYFVLEKVVRKAEILNDNEEWVESAHTIKEINDDNSVVSVTSTNDYNYYADLKRQLFYRIKRSQNEIHQGD